MAVGARRWVLLCCVVVPACIIGAGHGERLKARPRAVAASDAAAGPRRRSGGGGDRWRRFASSSSAVAAAAVAAAAAGAPHVGAQSPPAMEDFRRLDTNHDGKIDAVEWESVIVDLTGLLDGANKERAAELYIELYDYADINGDGFLSPREAEFGILVQFHAEMTLRHASPEASKQLDHLAEVLTKGRAPLHFEPTAWADAAEAAAEEMARPSPPRVPPPIPKAQEAAGVGRGRSRKWQTPHEAEVGEAILEALESFAFDEPHEELEDTQAEGHRGQGAEDPTGDAATKAKAQAGKRADGVVDIDDYSHAAAAMDRANLDIFGIALAKHIVRMHDTDLDGRLSREEYGTGIRNATYAWELWSFRDDPDVVQWMDDVWSAAEITGDGYLDERETLYAAWLAEEGFRRNLWPDKRLANLFIKLMDDDKDGLISADEMGGALREVEEDVGRQRRDTLIHGAMDWFGEADEDGDGQLTLKETLRLANLVLAAAEASVAAKVRAPVSP